MITMFETHTLLQKLVSGNPMTKKELQLDRIRMELEDIRGEIEKLKKKSADSDSSRSGRFDRYLDTLNAKRIEVRECLDATETEGEEPWDQIHQGLREAQQRLAIAKLAARSRFH
jgi:hypothetical protein